LIAIDEQRIVARESKLNGITCRCGHPREL
jgi:hypothetical protein